MSGWTLVAVWLLALIMLLALTGFFMWCKNKIHNWWWMSIIRKRFVPFAKSINEWNKQNKAIQGLGDFTAPGRNLPFGLSLQNAPHSSKNHPMHIDHLEVDEDGIVIALAIPKHQLPCGWFISDPTKIEREDDEVPLHLLVGAGTLCDSKYSRIEWFEVMYELDWFAPEYAYLIWEWPHEYALLRLSFSNEWMGKLIDAMRDDAGDRADEMKRGDK